MLHRLFRNNWLIGIVSVAEIILGFILLSFPYILGLSALVLAGIVLLMMGIMRLVLVFRTGVESIWNGLCAIAYIVLGGLMIASPLELLELVTLIGACMLIVIGTMRMIIAIISKKRAHVVWRMINALMSLILGVLVCATWPESSQWFLGVMIAIEMIFSGWTMLFLSIGARDETMGGQSEGQSI